jgi:septum formation protein
MVAKVSDDRMASVGSSSGSVIASSAVASGDGSVEGGSSIPRGYSRRRRERWRHGGTLGPVPPPRLVLASSSPRRREILDRLGLAYAVAPADLDETPRPGEEPIVYVERLAAAKANAVAEPGTVVIGADTTVVLDGEILGKPTDPDDAAAMLLRISGRDHEVITGVAVAVVPASGVVVVHHDHEVSTVRVRPLTPERVAWYVATGEAADKAGAYGLQGAAGLFADHVTGSVSNVIGLPMGLLDDVCTRAGVDLLAFRDRPGGLLP